MWRFVSLLLSAMLCLPAAAQVYEWIDEQGNRHFSDQEPEGVEFRILGDPAENLSSYAPSPIRTPRAGSRASGESAPKSGKTRRSSGIESRQELELICADYLRRIDVIQSQLRAGYREPRGNSLRARRSALQAAYRRDCT